MCDDEIDPSITCHSCEAVCCQDMRLPLFTEEAVELRAAGTTLITILDVSEQWEFDDQAPAVLKLVKWNWADHTDAIEKMAELEDDSVIKGFWQTVADDTRDMEPGQGLFVVDGRCGNLRSDNSCGAYEKRPGICREYIMGGVLCRELRHKRGIATPVKLIRKPDPVPTGAAVTNNTLI